MKKWATYCVLLIIIFYALLAFINFGLLWISESDLSLKMKEVFFYSMGFSSISGLAIGVLSVWDKRMVLVEGLSWSIAVGLGVGLATVYVFNWTAGLTAANLGFCASGLTFCLFFTLSKLFETYRKYKS